MASPIRPLAVVIGASSGIGRELAQQCAGHGFDVVVAADPPIEPAAASFRLPGVPVEAMPADLTTSAATTTW